MFFVLVFGRCDAPEVIRHYMASGMSPGRQRLQVSRDIGSVCVCVCVGGGGELDKKFNIKWKNKHHKKKFQKKKPKLN